VGKTKSHVWRYYDLGDSKKPPLICIHGIGGTAEIFFKLFFELPMQGIRIITVCVLSGKIMFHSFKIRLLMTRMTG
jgi:pimeloyl-ACP methyl ester carboxylesterase